MKDFFIAYRKITPEEESDKRKWARKHYIPGQNIKGTWHPVIQDECVKMNFGKIDTGLTIEQQNIIKNES
ncbi:MAG: hypothetical protein PHT07_14985 [Paludibacter sp.]|nr:hypothetical protein [Paludibacter sp.]